MRNKHYRIITVFALVAVVLLQVMWMWLNYRQVAQDVTDKAAEQMPWAMIYESSRRADRLTPDTLKLTGKTLTFEQTVKGYNDLMWKRFHSLESIDTIESYVRKLMSNAGMHYCVTTIQVDKDGRELAYSNDSCNAFSLKSRPFYTRLDSTRAVVLAINDPYGTICNRLETIFMASIAIVLIVVLSIWQQLRIIRRQEQIGKIRQDFSYAMIHDMKQPLSSIIMGIRNIQSGKLDGKPSVRNKILNIMQDEARHMLSLTNKVLTISKIEENRLTMNKSDVELSPMVEVLITKFKAKSTKPLAVNTQLNVKTVYADDEFLVEVLTNLMDNAIKYSGDSVTIDISSEETTEDVILKVKDDGIGISFKDQKVIFDKYERASAAGKAKNTASGFGLGLNYVKQVMQAHSGDVTVKSHLGKGTTFMLYFPKDSFLQNP